jgi:hypothetical protein
MTDSKVFTDTGLILFVGTGPLLTRKTHFKERIWPKPQGPPGFPTTAHLWVGIIIYIFYLGN